jgi:hypothetical protein
VRGGGDLSRVRVARAQRDTPPGRRQLPGLRRRGHRPGPAVESPTTRGQALSNSVCPPRRPSISELFAEPMLGISGSVARGLLSFERGGSAEAYARPRC